MKRKIFDTRVASVSGLSQQSSRILNYVVGNQHAALSTDDLTALISPIRTILKSPMAECFDRLVATGSLNNFVALYIQGKDQNIPEILTTSVFTIDLKQMNGSESLKSLPNLKDKILVNITNTLRKDRTGMLSIDAIDNFQHMFVKGQLVAAYADIRNWLNAYSAEYCIKSYSMVLSGIISRYYNLSILESFKVRTIFALFMAQMLNEEDSPLNPPYFSRATWGDMSERELREIATEAVELAGGKEFTLESLCSTLAQCVSEKMSKFDLGALMQMCGNLGSDLLVSKMALEFPPYWVFMLLQALSGIKSMLVYQLNQQRLVADGRTKFLHGVMMDSSIFDVRRY